MRRLIFYFFLIYGLAGCTVVKDISYSLEGTVLDLSEMGLNEIPPDVFLRTELKVLRLFGNSLTSIPDEIENLKNIYDINAKSGLNVRESPSTSGKIVDKLE